jgi:hypothetical protein
MTIISALLAAIGSAWPAVVGGASLLLAGMYAWVSKKSADTTKAQAAQSVAEAQRGEAQVQAAAERERTADARADADGAKSAADAAAARQEIEAKSAAMSSKEVQNEVDKWRTRS